MSKRKYAELESHHQAERQDSGRWKRLKLVPRRHSVSIGNSTLPSRAKKDEEHLQDQVLEVKSKSEKKHKKKASVHEQESLSNGVDTSTKEKRGTKRETDKKPRNNVNISTSPWPYGVSTAALPNSTETTPNESQQLIVHSASREEKKKWKNKRKPRGLKGDKKKLVDDLRSSWTVSEPVGGLQANLDSVFSADESHLLLAYHDSIRVYACSTSLLIRSLRLTRDSKLTSFHLSRTDTDLLYACFEDGHIELWNWREGIRSHTWETESRIIVSACAKATSPSDEPADVLITINEEESGCEIWTRQLDGMPGIAKVSQNTIYRSQSSFFLLRVSEEGRHVVAGASHRILIGAPIAEKSFKSQAGLNYKWWEFDTPGELLSLDSTILEPLGPVSKQTYAAVDVAAGCKDGTIHRYSNMGNALSQLENPKRHQEPSDNRLHWHRGPVSTVKWSRDGNYLISGGKETVLVLWQLDTGGHNTLPHLSSPILNIVVSPSGTSYAIHLADNSTMIVSTQELQPTFNVPSILLPSSIQLTNLRKDRPGFKHVTRRLDRRPAVILSKTSSAQIFLAVPPVASFDTSPLPSLGSSYLQTIDAKSGVQLSRQALTRTNVTDINQGPEGFVIDEPDTVLLQSSYDGKWLATVEEWSPPRRDLGALETSNKETLGARADRLETNLKLWAWSEEASTWELVTKIERPHSGSDTPQGTSYMILDLIADPSATGFLTLGEDSSIKVWRAKARFRHAVPVKDVHGRALMRWSSQRILRLPPVSSTLQKHTSQNQSRMALSNDGSTLVVGQSSKFSSVIFVIDLQTSQVTAIRPDIFSGTLRDLGFIGRHLIVMADELISWDVVNDELTWAIDLRKQLTTDVDQGTSHLTVNHANGTFAVGFANNFRKETTTWIAIFEASNSKPLLMHMLRQKVIALVPGPSQSFFAVDDKSQIHHIAPSAKKAILGAEIPEEAIQDEAQEIASSQGLDSIFGKRLISERMDEKTIEDTQPQPDPANQDTNFIRQHQLTEIFKYAQPFALPPITSIFEQVAEFIVGVKKK